MERVQRDALAHLRALADSLDCFTEEDLAVLAKSKVETLRQWRSRGTGPRYCRFGDTFLYPREGVRDFLAAKVREPRVGPGAAAMADAL